MNFTKKRAYDWIFWERGKGRRIQYAKAMRNVGVLCAYLAILNNKFARKGIGVLTMNKESCSL